MLGYRDSGHGRHAAQRAPRLVPPGRHRRGHRPAGGGHPPHPAAGHHHLRRRPARLPAPRPPAGARHLACWPSTAPATPTGTPSSASRSSRRSSTTRRGRGPGWSPIHEALLEPRRQVAVRREVVRAARTTTTGSRPRIDVGDFQCARSDVAAGPRHPGRPDRGVVVRARRRRAGRGLPVGGLDPRPVARRPDPRRPDRGRPVRRRARPSVERARRDDASSTASSSARRTSASTGPTTPTSWSRSPLAEVAGRRLRPDRRLHAGQAEGGRPDRAAVRPAPLGRGGDASSARLAARP